MKKAMKVLCILLCAVLLVVGSVAATLAYLTAATQKVTNTFTVGNVNITLNEAKVNNNGKPIDSNNEEVTDLAKANRVMSNSYNLVPGNDYTKDPTVTVLANSEASYVRMQVTVVGAKWSAISDYIYSNDTNGINSDWELVENSETKGSVTVDDETVDTYSYYFQYKTVTVKSASDAALPALFDEIKLPADIDKEDLAAIRTIKSIEVEAHAIQQDGFNTAADAWNAFVKPAV